MHGACVVVALHTSPSYRRPGPRRFVDHWPEMLQCLEVRPAQTAMELLTEFQARYPGFYKASHLRTLRRRVQVWRRQTIPRLICEMKGFTQDVGSGARVIIVTLADEHISFLSPNRNFWWVFRRNGL
jgi:hypothetical protein